MNSVHNAVKAVGICAAAIVIASGCATAKKPAEAAAPAAPAAAASEPAPASMPMAPAGDSYTVSAGDCLWCISGKSEIYGDPYQWPRLFRANRDQIKDADLIYPGQRLTVERSASAALKAAADRHARTRGAWSLGVTEDTDLAFLSANP
jgi:hypothetical protein